MRNLIDRTTIVFLLTGGVCTIVGYGTMFLMFNVGGCSYELSSAANVVIGAVLSYILNKHFTFQSKSANLVKEITLFALNAVISWVIGYGLAKPLILYLLSGASPFWQNNVAMVVGMIFYTIVNYIGQRFVVFPKK